MFEKFSHAFSPETGSRGVIDVPALTKFIETDLGVRCPIELIEFWKAFGSGYFGGRILYFFGDGNSSEPRDSFMAWNKKDFWPLIYPTPKNGGPVFFAESCYGEQLGFRWEGENCVFILFSVDTFEAFVIAKNGTELFDSLLVDKYAILDEQRFDAVLARLGPLQSGMHYSPLISPMVGGSGSAENFCFETPNVHFRTAIATFQSKYRGA